MGAQHARQFGWQDTYVFTKALGEMLVGQVVKVSSTSMHVCTHGALHACCP
jgi:hypothetical protein